MISNKSVKQKYKITMVLMMSAMVIFSGCGGQSQVEEETLILTEEEAPLEYTLAVAVIDDVRLTERINCTYRQTLDEEISFSVSGKRIDKIYVNTGDAVEKGQLLAELKNDNAQEDVQRLEYQIARNKLLLQYVDTSEKNDIDEKWAQFNYKSDGSDETRLQVEKEITELKQTNRYAREDYQDAIAMDQRELDELNESIRECSVYAGISGTVSQIRPGIEGSTSTQGETIMTIIDSSEGVFEANNIELASYFEEGQPVEITVGVGNAKETYQVVPYNKNEWNETMLFAVQDENASVAFSVGATGIIEILTAEAGQVLTVPLDAIHSADGETFVYVVSEDGMREVRWVETGLQGNSVVEIKSGLTEGEQVVLP